MSWFWVWQPDCRVWLKVWEYIVQLDDLPTKREVFRRKGYCTAVEKAFAA